MLSAVLSCEKPVTGPPGYESAKTEKGPSSVNSVSLFSTYCASCHGLQGQRAAGTGGVLSSSRLETLGSARIKDLILKGRGIMPPFENKLSPEEIDALIGFMVSR